MTFRKISETIEAFKTSYPLEQEIIVRENPSSANQCVLSTDELGLQANETEEKIKNLTVDAILLYLVFRISTGISTLLHNAFSLNQLIGITVGAAIGVICAFFIGQFHERILGGIRSLIPEQRIKIALDPYFGSKLAQTVSAFQER